VGALVVAVMVSPELRETIDLLGTRVLEIVGLA
jgi:hypothetical protein